MVGEWAKRAGLAVMLALVGWPAQAGEIIGLRVGEHPTFTRLVFDLDKPADHQVFALDAPNRIVVDLAVDGWRKPAIDGGSAMLAGWRFGQRAPGVARMVFDLAQPTKVTKTFTLDAEAVRPHRVIIDLQPVSAAVFANQIGRVLAKRGDWAIAGRAVSATTSASARNVAPTGQARVTPAALGATTARRQAPAGPPIIAIDAGHGGVDPGAIGPGGVREKDITLAMARELRAMIEADGRYRVFMTRDSDRFIPLRERVARARAAGAALFISVHADSINAPHLKGFSVYTVSDKASDKEAAALARRENKADLIGGVTEAAFEDAQVASILLDLSMRQTRKESMIFAETIVDALRGEVRLLKQPQRAAGFAVLKAPDTPSVLVELGFLSNKAEERLLTDPRHRRKIGACLIRAIDRFFAQVDAVRRT